MKIAVLSGKGGTGKTLLSVNLAAAAKESVYIDCDVEEPNGYLFFKPEAISVEEIAIRIPAVNHNLCNGCRICVDFCKFNALAFINHQVMIFEEVCHACGGCGLVCPEEAVFEKDKIIGEIQRGDSGNTKVITGILDIGEASGIPIIRKLLRDAPAGLTFIDCPPGSACIVMESVRDADYCILVTEPTLFGVHNLDMVYELVKLFDKPCGAVLNKCLEGENPAENYCRDNNLKIISRIPYDYELGLLNSNGLIAYRESPNYRDMFAALLQKVMEEAAYETTPNS